MFIVSKGPVWQYSQLGDSYQLRGWRSRPGRTPDTLSLVRWHSICTAGVGREQAGDWLSPGFGLAIVLWEPAGGVSGRVVVSTALAEIGGGGAPGYSE